MSATSTDLQPVVDGRGATILGPRNVPVELENPDVLVSPVTDAGTIPNLKFPYAMARNRVLSGGFAREVTARELPIATELAGVDMRLTPGGIREPHFSENETFLITITDSRNFTISERIAAALVEIEPGGMRELHWHPNADEWQYYLKGHGRMTVFASGGKARTFDYQAGDVGYVPFAMGHYVENTGEETLTFLEMFRSDHFADVSLSQWMGVLPPELVEAHLNLDDAVIAALPLTKPIAVRKTS